MINELFQFRSLKQNEQKPVDFLPDIRISNAHLTNQKVVIEVHIERSYDHFVMLNGE